jgi:putative membrane protein
MRIMISMSKGVMMLSLAGAAAFSAGSWAQTSPPSSPPSSGAGTATAEGDAHFVTTASAAGATEILASRLAAKQAQSAQVKSFAATMVHDHTAANDKLRTIAQKNGFPLAGVAMVEQQPDLVQLNNLNGADFDKAYIAMMRKDHQAAVTLFTSESSSGSNSDLKAFAAQTLPTIQHHLAMAQSL